MHRIFLLFFLLFLLPDHSCGGDFPLTFTDSAGEVIAIHEPPQRIVSLVPSVTEMLLAIGAGERLVGKTIHCPLQATTQAVALVGGFRAPDSKKIADLYPDIVFYADIQKENLRFLQGRAILVQLSASSIKDGFNHLLLLGRLCEASDRAEKVVAEQRRQLALIAEKTAKIPPEKRKRVLRLMGRDTALVPGDNSFQLDFIRAAGGIAPQFGKNGQIVAITPKKWRTFAPKIVYGCGKGDAPAFLEQEEWRLPNTPKYLSFPCDLTCRAATHVGDFVALLAASLYPEEFDDPKQQVRKDGITARRLLDIDIGYIRRAETVQSLIRDFTNKTLLLTFDRPMTILSTLAGWHKGVRFLGNHYFPPPSWGLGHDEGLDGLRFRTYSALHLPAKKTSMLFTGADMDNLAIGRASYQSMQVTALVTAGVLGNAMRMGADAGLYVETVKARNTGKPGTINIVLLTNRHLSPEAMARAVITATEAKTAALEDLDIRSSADGARLGATGTGTDNIAVVSGAGPTLTGTGGHTKMGELIARAVYEAVGQAISRQNDLYANRSIFQRLKERGLDSNHLVKQEDSAPDNIRAFERLLLMPRYAGFLTAMLAISDQYERGLLQDLAGVKLWCQTVADDIAGRPIALRPTELPNVPVVIGLALTALQSGLAGQETRQQ